MNKEKEDKTVSSIIWTETFSKKKQQEIRRRATETIEVEKGTDQFRNQQEIITWKWKPLKPKRFVEQNQQTNMEIIAANMFMFMPKNEAFCCLFEWMQE